jgi:hypothetical protein
MAYGQTGTGKSFSMMGSRKSPGLIPQIVAKMFETAEERKNGENIQVAFF